MERREKTTVLTDLTTSNKQNMCIAKGKTLHLGAKVGLLIVLQDWANSERRASQYKVA